MKTKSKILAKASLVKKLTPISVGVNYEASDFLGTSAELSVLMSLTQIQGFVDASFAVKVKQEFSVGLVIAAGYEQRECNEEGLTDFEDAIRIACEQMDMQAPTKKQRAEARKIFKQEFSRV